LLAEEEERFDAWLASQSDVATIFLDSIDELKLTLGSFEGALRRLNKAIAGQLGRTRIVITTRPIPVDHRLIQQLLPIPEKGELVASGEDFANIALGRQRDDKKDNKATDTAPAWRSVALMPLSNDQIRAMAVLQGVMDADVLLEDIRRRNAEDFARRPQDLIELCADWRDHRCIRTHREQVAHNIVIKLKSRMDRGEKAQLTEEKALEGASRLAIAALLTRKLTLRHSAEADKGGEEGAALDPSAILPDWSAAERETLLERALFGFASYGRVRFHHRSVIEYLAARHLESLLSRGMSMKAVKRLLFAETPQGLKVVKPSMRPVAAWLAFFQPSIFSEVRDREPDVLLNYADPESLTPPQRIDALRTYVERYGQGSWRGLHVPHVQTHRFASNELAPEILRLWQAGIENSEVRELLLELVAAAPMRDCADIAYSVVMQGDADSGERMDALNALIRINDSRLEAVTLSMETDRGIWSDEHLKSSILRLFPTHIQVERLCRILSRITESRRSIGDLNWFWSRSIAEADMTLGYLDALREGLTGLVMEGIEWREQWPHIVTPRQHLVVPLAAVCLRQLTDGYTSPAVASSSVIALRVRLRSAMKSIWRNDRPTLRTERPENEKGTFLIRWQLGLAAVAAEAEDPNWARRLSVGEAELAARYAPIELNGFPFWLESLAAVHPTVVEIVLGPELSYELDEIATANSYSMFLQNVSHASPSLTAAFLPGLRIWFDKNFQRLREGEDGAQVAERLRRVVDVLLRYGDNHAREHIRTVAAQQLAGGLDPAFAYVWLPTLMRLDPTTGTERLEQGLNGVEPGPQGLGVDWVGLLFGDRHNDSLVDLHLPEFTPNLLLRLVRLAYRYVRPAEDISHEGAYSPGPRDHAQRARDALLNAILGTKGPEGWAVKLEMSDDPLFVHFRDRTLMIAREKAAEEADGVALSESEVIAFDHNREASPATRDEMFALMIDRLDDLDDLLLRDDSPRAAWAGISDEKVMRREIARELRNAANHIYTVDQEGVTADEKETDIRLRAATSDQQAVIELKLGDGRPGRDLRDTIKEQLVTKYMAPDVCRSGCLLVTVAKDRNWEHPDSKELLDVVGLEAMLQVEASKIVAEMNSALRLTTRVLDLRPRLPTEKKVVPAQKHKPASD